MGHPVNRLLQEEWSLEQIKGWLRLCRSHSVSHAWSFQHIYHNTWVPETLFRHWRSQCQRRKRYGTYRGRGHLPTRISIEQRPAIVEHRSRLGNWERDTIIGKRSHQERVSLTERQSRLRLIAKGPAEVPILWPDSAVLSQAPALRDHSSGGNSEGREQTQ